RADSGAGLRRWLALQVVAEGCGLHWIEAPAERRALAALVAMAERAQQRDPRVLGELWHWIDPEVLAAGAGVPEFALGPSGEVGHAAEFPLRDFTGGGRPRAGGVGTHRPEPRPVVAVLTTSDDGPADWLRAGQALLRLLPPGSSPARAASFPRPPPAAP